jgi:ribonuclease PH
MDTTIAPHAEGACLVSFGKTQVICTVTVEEKVPSFLKGTGKGWITAEYGMLPRATHQRTDREAARGKQTGRTQEIQRLIGRSLRAITDLSQVGERQFRVDCDVIQADGGTRTAAISGSFVALYRAMEGLKAAKKISQLPFHGFLAAVSCGIVKGEALLDLDYQEDSQAHVDANFVLSDQGGIIEIQTTAEKHPITEGQFHDLWTLALTGARQIVAFQKKTLGLVETQN